MHQARVAAAGPRPASAPAPAGRARRGPKGRWFVGCSGWFYWHWRNGFYPPGSRTAEWFDHYADTFDTVELNAPFYCWPKVSAVQGWGRQAGARDFVYTVKVSDLITHVKRFVGTKRLVEDFYHVADILGPRMGCFLFQLPPSYRYTKARLNAIVRQLDPGRRNVVEFRHASWWNETVYAAFREKGIVFCSCSGPRLPDALVKTADEVYVRFHGTKRWYRHDYSAEELAVWAERIGESGAKKVWAYFNNDRECHAIRNALELRRQLKGKGAAKAKRAGRAERAGAEVSSSERASGAGPRGGARRAPVGGSTRPAPLRRR